MKELNDKLDEVITKGDEFNTISNELNTKLKSL